MPSWDKTHNI